MALLAARHVLSAITDFLVLAEQPSNILTVPFQYLPRGNEENHETFSQNSRSPGQGFEPGPAEYESGLPTAIRRSKVPMAKS